MLLDTPGGGMEWNDCRVSRIVSQWALYMTDDEAVLGCQSGDRDAFRHLVEPYRDVLYGTAVLMTNDRALAEEQVQEALLSAWKGIRGFRRGRPFKPWLMRILVNSVLAHQRRRSVRTVPLEEWDRLDEWAGPTESVVANERRLTVRQALLRLTPNHRQVVVLRYFAELTVPQVARSIGIREGTVKSRLHRALGQLRDELRGFVDGEGDHHAEQSET